MKIRVSIHDKANPAPTHQLRQIYELLIIVCCHVPEGVGGIAFTVDVIKDESNFLEMCGAEESRYAVDDDVEAVGVTG